MKFKNFILTITVSISALGTSNLMAGVLFAQTPTPISSPLPTPSPTPRNRFSSPTPGNSTLREEIIYSPPTAFFCDIRDRKDDKGKVIQKDVPTTMIKTKAGEVVAYHWIKPIYSNPVDTPLARCSRVALILDSFNRNKNLNLIKAGEINGKPVICASNKLDSPCSSLIFPLEPDENPTKVLEDLHIALKGLPVEVVVVSRPFKNGGRSQIIRRNTLLKSLSGFSVRRKSLGGR